MSSTIENFFLLKSHIRYEIKKRNRNKIIENSGHILSASEDGTYCQLSEKIIVLLYFTKLDHKSIQKNLIAKGSRKTAQERKTNIDNFAKRTF